MKQIKSLASTILKISTEGTDLFKAEELGKQARRNKAKVLDGALTIEAHLSDLIRYYFFGKRSPARKAFGELILDSDWCTFSAKRKLVGHINR